MKRPAFTLIELLIVVAIISILAGIAVPNFLEAQTRAKIARVQNDHRVLATGLEAYAADYQKYPPSTVVPPFQRLVPLTTPVAYLSEVPADVFRARDLFVIHGLDVRIFANYGYGAMPIDSESRWAMASVGPDLRHDHHLIDFYPGYSDSLWENPDSGFNFIRYDATNGTLSDGDLWRVSDHQMP